MFSRRFTRTAFTIMTLTVVALLGPVSAARAGASITPEYSTQTGAGFVTIKNSAGKTAGWMSNSYLASHPNAIRGHTSTRAQSSGTVKPMDASGCTGSNNVCIYLYGAYVNITEWDTTAVGNAGCIHAHFLWYDSSQHEQSGPLICPSQSGDGVYYDYTGPTGNYYNDTEACNTWDYLDGRACEYITY